MGYIREMKRGGPLVLAGTLLEYTEKKQEAEKMTGWMMSTEIMKTAWSITLGMRLEKEGQTKRGIFSL